MISTLSFYKCHILWKNFNFYARMTFSRSKIWPQILTTKKSMEVMIYLRQIFYDNGLLLLEDIHKVWRGCLILFQRNDYQKKIQANKSWPSYFFIGQNLRSYFCLFFSTEVKKHFLRMWHIEQDSVKITLKSSTKVTAIYSFDVGLESVNFRSPYLEIRR